MKIILKLILTVLIFSSCSKNNNIEKTIEITEIKIPDINFEQALIDYGVDTNGLSGTILIRDAEAVTELVIQDKSITNMQGIEAFVGLKTLVCSYNNIMNLDITNNLLLETLICGNNQLFDLNVTNLKHLIYLDAADNQITDLDISHNKALVYLDISLNQISHLDLDYNVGLKYMYVFNNQFTNLDISENVALIQLYCENNQLFSVDTSNNIALKELSYGND
ncbi:leucine-rich repeat domain-containing protein [Ichthyenterobacterium magnum]|uniref:Leucine rich repeat (LRR) protein n=1 Tax=Ichthyenterobacterium magnum TaxID=1230530 RepID=A0A420DVB1_9FLAO|nr:hypothetical protein [Ichthyenterobacterium magnum]RKE98128.1 hypothetical protein BXY80_0202 [Ichthyenterobacterium magnum]